MLKTLTPKKRFRREDLPLYIMALPTVVWLVIFCYLPIFGLVMAFQDLNITKGIWGSPFVGLKNFQFLFVSTDAWVITRNTVCYNLVFIAVNLILAVLMSLLLSELRSRMMAKTLQTIYMLPHFLSWAVVAIVLGAFLDYDYGIVNRVMINLGRQTTKLDWYQQRSLWPGLLVGINAWKNVGYSTVLYLAVISGISQDYYEAAVLDGANKLQQAWYITIPHMRLVIGVSLILSMGNIFRGDFGLFYVVTKNSGRIYAVTDVIDTYVFRTLRQTGNPSQSMAVSLFQSVLGFIMVCGANWTARRFFSEGALF